MPWDKIQATERTFSDTINDFYDYAAAIAAQDQTPPNVDLAEVRDVLTTINYKLDRLLGVTSSGVIMPTPLEVKQYGKG